MPILNIALYISIYSEYSRAYSKQERTTDSPLTNELLSYDTFSINKIGTWMHFLRIPICILDL